jgi:hypothetical protein
MSHYRMNTKSVAHESTGGTLASIPRPVDPVGNAPDCLTFQTVLQRGVRSNRTFSADQWTPVFSFTPVMGAPISVFAPPATRRKISRCGLAPV